MRSWEMIETQPGLSFRHSAECTLILHGESLAGCLKVRWTDGERSWYRDCCRGELVPVRRFDEEYRQDLIAGVTPLSGTDEIFAKVGRIGGENPPRVKLEIAGIGSGTYDVKSKRLARDLASHLYETVKIHVNAQWHPKTLELVELEVTGIDTSWQDVHLADVLEENKGILPVNLLFSDTKELVRLRQEDRQ